VWHFFSTLDQHELKNEEVPEEAATKGRWQASSVFFQALLLFKLVLELKEDLEEEDH